jgi:purine-cytosine permease-like protein
MEPIQHQDTGLSAGYAFVRKRPDQEESNFHITFWFSVMLIITLIDFWAVFERQALENLARYLIIALTLLFTVATIRWHTTKAAHAEGAEVRFEQEPTPAVMALDLGRDGALTIDS